MKQPIKRTLFFLMAVIFLLSACAPATAATQDPALVQQLIEQSVALTVAAQNAQTEAAQPQEVPATNTPLPTQTEAVLPTPTPLIPTVTPVVLAPPTNIPSGSGGSTFVKPDFACDIIRQRPYDNTIFRPNDTFDIKWTIVNTGTKTMRAGLDLKYNTGEQMTNVTRVELPELKPGDQYPVDFDGVAPAKEGTYVMTFIVEGGLCYPYIVIEVEK